jgi:hypothetical protein
MRMLVQEEGARLRLEEATRAAKVSGERLLEQVAALEVKMKNSLKLAESVLITIVPHTHQGFSLKQHFWVRNLTPHLQQPVTNPRESSSRHGQFFHPPSLRHSRIENYDSLVTSVYPTRASGYSQTSSLSLAGPTLSERSDNRRSVVIQPVRKRLLYNALLVNQSGNQVNPVPVPQNTTHTPNEHQEKFWYEAGLPSYVCCILVIKSTNPSPLLQFNSRQVTKSEHARFAHKNPKHDAHGNIVRIIYIPVVQHSTHFMLDLLPHSCIGYTEPPIKKLA